MQSFLQLLVIMKVLSKLVPLKGEKKAVNFYIGDPSSTTLNSNYQRRLPAEGEDTPFY